MELSNKTNKSASNLLKLIFEAINTGLSSPSSITKYINEQKHQSFVDKQIKRKLAYSTLHRYLKKYGDRNKPHYQLTSKGLDKLLLLKFKSSNIEIQTWDGKWRIIMFDIPEENRALRDKIRYLVKSLGLIKLQHSVWITPYNFQKQFNLLKQAYPSVNHLIFLEFRDFDLADKFKPYWNL